MKRLIFLSITLVLCGVLAFVSFAHGGKTDANGGHYNRSTGEYHYHHGHPAHQHYDMDGDGIDDCIYSYKDDTNRGKITKENTTKSNITHSGTAQKQNQNPVTTSQSKSSSAAGLVNKSQEKERKFDIKDIPSLLCGLFLTACAGYMLSLFAVAGVYFVLEKFFGITVSDDVLLKITRWISVATTIIILIYILYR